MGEVNIWKKGFNKEIALARSARDSGNEGRARVCARRAAGIAAGEYLSQIQPTYKIKGALENLSNLQSHVDVSESIKDNVNLFLMHVDYDHKLPIDVDLIQEAIDLKEKLLSPMG